MEHAQALQYFQKFFVFWIRTWIWRECLFNTLGPLQLIRDTLATNFRLEKFIFERFQFLCLINLEFTDASFLESADVVISCQLVVKYLSLNIFINLLQPIEVAWLIGQWATRPKIIAVKDEFSFFISSLVSRNLYWSNCIILTKSALGLHSKSTHLNSKYAF